MTSGKNLHKPATPAISVSKTRIEAPANPAPHVDVKPAAVAAPQTVSHEEIAKLAYSYWLERGCVHGYAEEDWLRAERELSGR
jgi:hypothetical protein